MMDYETVRLCAVEFLVALDDVVREQRHEHHGDVVDGCRLALVDAMRAVGAREPLTSECTPDTDAARRIAKRFNSALGPVVGKWHTVGYSAVAEAVWYVNYGLTVARPYTIDVAILNDLKEFESAIRFADYRAHVEFVRAAIARL